MLLNACQLFLPSISINIHQSWLYFLLISWSQYQQVGCGRFCLNRVFIIIFICLYLCWKDVQCAQVYLEFNVTWERIICSACYRKLIPCWSRIFSMTWIPSTRTDCWPMIQALFLELQCLLACMYHVLLLVLVTVLHQYLSV